MISVEGGHIFVVILLKGHRSAYTTNQTINRLFCNRIVDSLLCKFSQNVLQKDVLRENTLELFCSNRASGPLTVGPPALRGAKHRGIYLRHVLQINTFQLDFVKMAAKLRFSRIGKREFLRDPKKYTFGKSIFKTFCKNRKTQILPPFLSTSNT